MLREWKDYVLDGFQREALAAIEAGESVIVAAPTGAGKTLVAEFALARALEEGRRIIYTAPIKALSNQKFRDLGATYGARVGIMTGDVTINPTADALIMTTEIFRNTIFDNPERLKGIRYVILDEAHYLDDPERGTVWEESIIFAPPDIRFICLSATISNLSEFAAWVRKVRPGRLHVVLEERRPVPLHPFVSLGDEVVELGDLGAAARRRTARGRRGRRGPQEPVNFVRQNLALVHVLDARDHLPAIFFTFSRDFCEKMAFAAGGRNLLSAEEGEEMAALVDALEREFDLTGDATAARLRRILLRGVAYHHAGMLPTLKEVVERLFTSGLVKLLFATETFALGVNMPARAVAFESLKKFDGVKRAYMKTREFLQMAGRAGRRGIDREGFVYACVQPDREHASDVRAVILGEVEEVESQFNLSYATLLHLYSHLGEAIYEACEKSFVHFRHKRRKGGPFQDMVGQVKRRLSLLEELGYLEGRRLTPKGRFASLIYGYELPAAELFFEGVLERVDVPELCVLLAACVYEAKRDTWFVALRNDVLEPLRRPAEALLAPIVEREEDLGIRFGTRRPRFDLARATWEWARGAPFETLTEYADVSPGDLIRVFRLTIQLLRQLLKPLKHLDRDTTAFRRKVLDAMTCLKRDVVDAERQLRQSVRAEAGEEAAARIPPEALDEGAEGEPDLRHVVGEREGAEGEMTFFLGGGGPAVAGGSRAGDVPPPARIERAIEHAPEDLEVIEIFDLDREEREAAARAERERRATARAPGEAAAASAHEAAGAAPPERPRRPPPRREPPAEPLSTLGEPPPGTLDALRAERRERGDRVETVERVDRGRGRGRRERGPPAPAQEEADERPRGRRGARTRGPKGFFRPGGPVKRRGKLGGRGGGGARRGGRGRGRRRFGRRG